VLEVGAKKRVENQSQGFFFYLASDWLKKQHVGYDWFKKVVRVLLVSYLQSFTNQKKRKQVNYFSIKRSKLLLLVFKIIFSSSGRRSKHITSSGT